MSVAYENDPTQMHAYGFHDQVPHESCGHCQERIREIKAQLHKDNLALALGIALLLIGFIMAVVLIASVPT